MITIHKSQTADTRSCDFANVSKETLLASSEQHIGDVKNGLRFMQRKIDEAIAVHDYDKLTDIDGFHADFVTGFKQTGWWDRHRQLNRHHLLAEDGVRDDVNLIDVLDFITDCVMAGMARTGTVYPLDIKPEVLRKAFDNTVELLKANVRVAEPANANTSPVLQTAERYYQFVEPHQSGGHCVVVMTESQAIAWQKFTRKASTGNEYASDLEALEDFKSIHWASQVEPPTIADKAIEADRKLAIPMS